MGVVVRSQGVALDWQSATGDFDTVEWGVLESDRLFGALYHLSRLTPPADNSLCPPQLVTEGPAGLFSFMATGDGLESPETGSPVTPAQGVDLALGRRLPGEIALAHGVTPPPPAPTPPAPPSRPAPGRQPRQARPTFRRPMTWRQYLAILIGLAFGFVALIGFVGAIEARTMEDKGVALGMGVLFTILGIVTVVLSMKARPHVDQDGNILTGIMFAHMMNMDDYSGDSSDSSGGVD